MTLTEYVESIKKHLDTFVVRYNEGAEKMPNAFPKEMLAGEWDEQFMAYLNLTEGAE